MDKEKRQIPKRWIIPFVLPLTFLLVHPVIGKEKPFTTDLTIGLYNQYVWRGYELSKDSLVIQPSFSVDYNGFGVNLWGNFDTDQYDLDKGNWNETDLTISYSGAVSGVTYDIGYIYYALEDGEEDTQEVYATLGLDALLSPTFGIYRDVDNNPGWYISLGVGHSFVISETLILELGAQVGYVDDDQDYSAFHDGLISLSLSYSINDHIALTPELYYSFPLSSDSEEVLQDASYSGEDDSFVYGGILVHFSF